VKLNRERVISNLNEIDEAAGQLMKIKDIPK
jgi:hypothetical protein